MKNPTTGPGPSRRRFITGGCRLAATCLCLPLLDLFAGCGPGTEDAPPPPLRVELGSLPLGRRVRFEHDGRPVEIIRTADGVTARSLLCTHQGCNVSWIEADGIYLFPCHDGQFDAQGRPIYGPPREPLRDLAVTVTDTEVIVGG
jgi:Rieske Fe-S protein